MDKTTQTLKSIKELNTHAIKILNSPGKIYYLFYHIEFLVWLLLG